LFAHLGLTLLDQSPIDPESVLRYFCTETLKLSECDGPAQAGGGRPAKNGAGRSHSDTGTFHLRGTIQCDLNW